MPFITVDAACELSFEEREKLRLGFTEVFGGVETAAEVTAVAVSCGLPGNGSREGRVLSITTAMQPRPPETVEKLEAGYARLAAELGFEMGSNTFVQVLADEWPQPKWAR